MLNIKHLIENQTYWQPVAGLASISTIELFYSKPFTNLVINNTNIFVYFHNKHHNIIATELIPNKLNKCLILSQVNFNKELDNVLQIQYVISTETVRQLELPYSMIKLLIQLGYGVTYDSSSLCIEEINFSPWLIPKNHLFKIRYFADEYYNHY